MAFIAMELVAGAERIDAWARRTGPDLPHRARMLAEVCDAIAHAHARGVIHGDLKPGNILVDADGAPRVIDFGVARALGVDESLQQSRGGTPGYAAPEQEHATAGPLDGRADVYALGVLARELTRDAATTDAQARDLGAIIDSATHPQRTERLESPLALAENLRALADGALVPATGRSTRARMRHRVRTSVRRAPWAWVLGSTVIGFVAAWLIGVPLVHAWTPIARWTVSALGGVPRVGAAAPVLEDVRVILLRDADDIDALAASQGLSEVRTEDLQSWRRLHGRLMERLRAASPRVVVWDIIFEKPSDADEDFVRGIRTLQANGIGVVVAARNWALDADGLPMVSRAVLEAAGWGAASGVHSSAEPWRVDLLVDRGDGSGITPSLALRTLGAMHGPTTEMQIALDRAAGIATVRLWRPVARVPSARGMSGPARTLKLSAVETPAPQNASLGIRADDRVGVLIIDVPDEQTLASHTIGYSEVFEKSAQELRESFAGKAVVIGNVRNGQDMWPHPSGRAIPGPWSHACAIGALIRGGVIRVPTPRWDAIGTAVFALAGGAAGILSGRARARGVFLACLAAVGAGLAVGLYAFSDLLVITPVQMIGAIAAFEVAGIGARARD
jgi:CHASE2 domain-containing sensor protein